MNSGRCVWDPRNTRRDIRAVQNSNYLQLPLNHLSKGIYSISLSIHKAVFNKDYPNNPQSFGKKLKKARMDAGLQIKELASIVGVTEDSIINWEKRGIMPSSKNLKEVKKFIGLSHY
jgi:DNA-binding XRE family transcriptional regulator